MSDFKFSCPACGQHAVCDTSNAGMQIPCPSCQTLLTVPQPPAAPAAPQVPATPGKLSINKAAHQSHAAPPPGAPKAPAAAPAWGAKPPAPAPKKKSPLVTIIIAVAALAVVGIGGWIGYSKYQEAQEQKRIAAEEQAKREKEAADRAAAEKRAKAEAAKAVWKLDLANAKFPERPASGKHHGTEFKVEKASFQGTSLSLLQTSGSVRQFLISVPLKAGETIAGKTLDIAATNTGVIPRVILNWKDADAKAPASEPFTKGYAMKLEFGDAANGHIPGKIYLCVPDAAQSFVAGNFDIVPKTPAKPAGAAGNARPPRPSRALKPQ